MTELEQRIQRLEDIEAIRVLKARYFHACDRKDTETIKQCFALGNINIDYGAIGQFTRREDFLEAYQDMACHDYIVDMHHGHNAQIEWISPLEAQATWDLYFHQIDNQSQTHTQLAGFYDDIYQKRNGLWVMVYSKFTVTSSSVTPMPPA